MKEKEPVTLEQHDRDYLPEAEEQQRMAKKGSLAVFLSVVLLFTIVMFVTYFFELKFGKAAGTISLIILAAILAAWLYRREIFDKLKRKK